VPSRRRGRGERRVAVWIFAVVLLLVFTAGTAGGYRFKAGDWPWGNIKPAGAVSFAGPTGKRLDQTSERPEAIAHYLPSVVGIHAKGSGGEKQGSGFIMDDRGHVVTAAHVVEEGSACVTVVDDNGKEHQGIVLQFDHTLDVALLHVADLEHWASHLGLETANPPAAVGDSTYVIGSPLGVGNNLPLSALVARLGVDQTVQGRYHKGLIELADVGVAEGTSGGPLISKATGRVVGVVLLSGHPTAVAWARPITDVSAKLREWALLPAGTSCQLTRAAKTIPLTLVTITPRTGVNSLEGEDLADGVELAIREKKDDLARVGYQVSIQREDDAGSPDIARDKANTVAQDPKVIAVVGSLGSQATRAVGQALSASGMPIVAPTAGADDLTTYNWSNFNRIVARSGRQDQVLANFAKDLLKVNSVFVLEDGSPDADNQLSGFVSAAQTISLKVAGAPTTVTGNTDPADIRKKLAESRAEAVYYAGNSEIIVRLIRALRADGVTLPFLGNQSAFAPSQFQAYVDGGAQGIYFTRLTAEPPEQFRRRFEEIAGKPTGGYAAYGYDAARVILEQLVAYGEAHPAQAPSRADLARLVRGTKGWPGWTALISFDANGENLTPAIHVYEWKQGRPEYKLRAGF
jgi:branched-chain amino acid transport system substrate-binding protein